MGWHRADWQPIERIGDVVTYQCAREKTRIVNEDRMTPIAAIDLLHAAAERLRDGSGRPHDRPTAALLSWAADAWVPAAGPARAAMQRHVVAIADAILGEVAR